MDPMHLSSQFGEFSCFIPDNENRVESFQEEDFRKSAKFCGDDNWNDDKFKDHPKDLKGNNDLLSLTRPDVINEIHRRYMEAGADIVETNTFSGTTVAQVPHSIEHFPRGSNHC
jgi:methionine synthase I (cobalamin-dependent)